MRTDILYAYTCVTPPRPTHQPRPLPAPPPPKPASKHGLGMVGQTFTSRVLSLL